jgi:hypothetical protein
MSPAMSPNYNTSSPSSEPVVTSIRSSLRHPEPNKNKTTVLRKKWISETTGVCPFRPGKDRRLHYSGKGDPHHSYTVQPKVDPTQTNQGQMSRSAPVAEYSGQTAHTLVSLVLVALVSMFLCSLVL